MAATDMLGSVLSVGGHLELQLLPAAPLAGPPALTVTLFQASENELLTYHLL